MDKHRILFDIRVIFQEPSLRVNVDKLQEQNQVKAYNRPQINDHPQIKVDNTQDKCDPLKNGKIELIESFLIKDCLDYKIKGHHKPIILQKLLQKLERQTNLCFQRRKILFYLPKSQIYINCENYPLNQNMLIRPENYYMNQEITIVAKMRGEISIIKLKPKIKTQEVQISEPNINGISLFHSFVFSEVKESYSDVVEQFAQQQKLQQVLKQKRQKKTKKSQQGRRLNERRIGFAINKVVVWTKWAARYRHTWNRLRPEQIHKPLLSLEDAADVVGIPKKTLDDYLFHIQIGEKFKFNFNEHCMDRFAVLRMFVAKHNKEYKANPIMIANIPKIERKPVKKLTKKQWKLKQKEKEKREGEQWRDGE